MDWKPISEAPKDGRPLWVRGWDWGKPDTSRHYGWAFWNGAEWIWAGADGGSATHLTDYAPEPRA